jgi:hypothetical protein
MAGWVLRAAILCCVLVVVPVVDSGVTASSPGALPPVLTLSFDIADLPDVPATAIGVALNVTVAGPAAAGFLTVFPCASGRPLASNLNYTADQVVPNFVLTAVDADGLFCIETMSLTDVVVDLAGYVPAGSPLVMLSEPRRFADTRKPGDEAGIRLRAGETRSVRIAGRLGVPADAAAVVFNATAVDPDRSGFLTVFPCGRGTPGTSTLNFTRGAVVPNLVTTAVGAGGSVCFYAIADVDLVADVAAFVPAGASGVELLPAPERIFDTRNGRGGATGPLGPSTTRVQVTGIAGVPAGALAAIVNLTATESGAAGFVVAWPCDQPRPLASNLNFLPGQNVANFAAVRLAADGSLCLSSNTTVHGIVDVAGSVASASAFVPLTPVRIGDTREPVGPRCGLVVTNPDAGPMQWFDLTTSLLGPAMPSFFVGSLFWMEIASDCGSVWAALSTRELVQVDRNGTVLRRERIADEVGLLNIFMSDFGPLAIVNSPAGPQVVEPISGSVVYQFTALDGAQPWQVAAVSRDLSTFYFYVRLPDGTLRVHVVDGDDTLLSTFTLPAGADFFAVSPSGVYLSFGVRVGGPAGETIPETRVITPWGDLVESRPTKVGDVVYGARLHFTGDGTVLTCSNVTPRLNEPRAARWDLFGQPYRMGTGTWCPRAAL